MTPANNPCQNLLLGVIEQAVWDWDQLVLRGKIADPGDVRDRKGVLSGITRESVLELQRFFRGPWFARLLKVAAPGMNAKAAADRILNRTADEVLRNRRDAELRKQYPTVYAWWKAGIRDVDELTARLIETEDNTRSRLVRTEALARMAYAFHRRRVQAMLKKFERPIRLKSIRRKVVSAPLEASLV